MAGAGAARVRAVRRVWTGFRAFASGRGATVIAGILAEVVWSAAMARRVGTSRTTQSRSVAVSGAMPGDAGNTAGSSAGTRSMTVRRVSALVPWRA